jgi:hypothetical protein
MDEDVLMAAVLAETWSLSDQVDAEREANLVGELMTRVCDAAMPQSRPAPRRAAYWWSDEIAELRRLATSARRQF